MTEVSTSRIVLATTAAADHGFRQVLAEAVKFTQEDLDAGKISEDEAVGMLAGLSMAWQAWGVVVKAISEEASHFEIAVEALRAQTPAEDAFPGLYL